MQDQLKLVQDDLYIDADGDGIPDIKQGSTVTIKAMKEEMNEFLKYFKKPDSLFVE